MDPLNGKPPEVRPPTHRATTRAAADSGARPRAMTGGDMQGEGNYTAARKFNDADTLRWPARRTPKGVK